VQACSNERLSRVPLQARFRLLLETMEISESRTLASRISHVFVSYALRKSDIFGLTGSFVSLPLVKGAKTLGTMYKLCSLHISIRSYFYFATI